MYTIYIRTQRGVHVKIDQNPGGKGSASRKVVDSGDDVGQSTQTAPTGRHITDGVRPLTRRTRRR